MTCQKTRCRWRECPGCGRERRLARDSRVMCQHNRWEPAVWAMVPCEGSGQEPLPQDGAGPVAGPAPVGAVSGETVGAGVRVPSAAVRQGAA